MNHTAESNNLAYTVYVSYGQTMQTLAEYLPLHIAVEKVRDNCKADVHPIQSAAIVNNTTGAAMIFLNVYGEAVQVSGPSFLQSEGE